MIAAAVAMAVLLGAIAEGLYSVEARAIFAILVWAVVISGVAFRLFPRSRPPDAALVGGGLLALLALLTGVSVAWASDDGTAVQEVVRVGGYLGLFALVVCASRDGDLRPWLRGLAIGIAAVAVLALISRLVPPWPGGDDEITEVLPSAKGRLSYPIGYWNGLAALLAMGALLLIWFGAFAGSRRHRSIATATLPMLGLAMYLTSSRGGFVSLAVGAVALLALGPRRGGIAITALLGFVGALLAIAVASGQPLLIEGETSGEATWEGLQVLAATITVTALVGATRAALDDFRLDVRLPRPNRGLALVAVAVALAGIIFALDPVQRFEEFKELPTPETVDGQRVITADLERISGSGRWQFWTEAVDAFTEQPLYGLGAGGFGNYWNQHATIDQVITQPHSLYLELLAELGPAALLLLVGFLLLGPVRGLRDRSVFADPDAVSALVGLIVAGAVSAAFDWTWELSVVFGPLIVAGALLMGPALTPAALVYLRVLTDERNGGSRLQPAARLPGRVAVLAAGAVVVLLAANSLLGERRLEASRAAADDGNAERAADEAEAAIVLQPWAAEPRLQLALLQESAGDLDAAEESIREAIERSPEDWTLWLTRSRIAAFDSRLPQAFRAYQRARELNPRAEIFRVAEQDEEPGSRRRGP